MGYQKQKDKRVLLVAKREQENRMKLRLVLDLYLKRTYEPITTLAMYFLMPENVEYIRRCVEQKLRELLATEKLLVVVDEDFASAMVDIMISAPGLTATQKNLMYLNNVAVQKLRDNSYDLLRESAYNQRLLANHKPSNIEEPVFEGPKKHTQSVSTWNYDSHAPGRQWYDSYLKRIHGVEMKPEAKGMSRSNFNRIIDAPGSARRAMHEEYAMNGGRGMPKCY